jgi:hypothetical protein
MWFGMRVSVGYDVRYCGGVRLSVGEEFILSPGGGERVGVVVVSRIRLTGVTGDLRISKLVRLVLFSLAWGGGFDVAVVVVVVCGGVTGFGWYTIGLRVWCGGC